MLFAVLVMAQGGDLPPSSGDITEGQILTQEQLDSINPDTLDLGCVVQEVGQDHQEFLGGEWIWLRNTNCLAFESQGNGTYKVINKPLVMSFKIRDRDECINNFEFNESEGETLDDGIAYCDDYYASDLSSQEKAESELILENLKEFQIEPIYNMDNFNDDFDDVYDEDEQGDGDGQGDEDEQGNEG